tara:strand:- start:219 stop:1034 length:816 start_codon:yes stop_codon:yes gene_type:complete
MEVVPGARVIKIGDVNTTAVYVHDGVLYATILPTTKLSRLAHHKRKLVERPRGENGEYLTIKEMNSEQLSQYNKWRKQRHKVNNYDKWLDSARRSNAKRYEDPTKRKKILASNTRNRKLTKNKVIAKEYSLHYMRKRRMSSVHKLVDRCRSRLYQFMKSVGDTKRWQTANLVGCTSEKLNIYLKFDGTGHVDHIFPMALYARSGLVVDQWVKMAMHYTNLQVLSAAENLEKHDRLPTKAMAAKVARWAWPPGITEDMLPDVYEGWLSALRM